MCFSQSQGVRLIKDHAYQNHLSIRFNFASGRDWLITCAKQTWQNESCLLSICKPWPYLHRWNPFFWSLLEAQAGCRIRLLLWQSADPRGLSEDLEDADDKLSELLQLTYLWKLLSQSSKFEWWPVKPKKCKSNLTTVFPPCIFKYKFQFCFALSARINFRKLFVIIRTRKWAPLWIKIKNMDSHINCFNDFFLFNKSSALQRLFCSQIKCFV